MYYRIRRMRCHCLQRCSRFLPGSIRRFNFLPQKQKEKTLEAI